ncbi:MAG: efflux RND transporter periplasmic adaptor subunit [Nitrospira sp.]|nr:efflux RND transporter periplasmic adaptor subunit [Nitrospira sp.]
MNMIRVVVGVLLCGVGTIVAFNLWDRSALESAGPKEEAERPAMVDAAPVTVGAITESLQAVGTLQAVFSITVRSEIPGVIRRIDFSDGLSVERAASLIELDQEELQAQANQAAAQEKLAQVTYERLRRLSGQQTTIVPAQQVDEARLALQAAAANSVLYAVRLKKSVIRAPFAGTLGLRRVSVGDYVQPGQDIVNLEDLRTLHVDFKVPEVWLGRLFVGQRLAVTTDAFPDVPFEGQVSAIDPRVDAVNRTVAVRAAVPNPDGRLRPGLFATVRLTLGQEAHALLIPEEAVFLQRDKAMVFRVDDQFVRLTEAVVGARERGMVQIRTGLKEGDRVVRTGTHKLHDGLRVTIK